MLYRLSYTHHAFRGTTLRAADRGSVPAGSRAHGCGSGQAAGVSGQPLLAPDSDPPCSAASAFAVSESGPGGGTNIAAR